MFHSTTDRDIEMMKEKVGQLQKTYRELFTAAANELKAHVSTLNLSYSTLCLKPSPTQDISKISEQVELAKEDDKVNMFEDYNESDFLNYFMLEEIVNRHGDEKLKMKMVDYVTKMKVFRKETKVQIFSKVFNSVKVNKKFHITSFKDEKLDWATATLDDVEQLRIRLCNEFHLNTFSLHILELSEGSITVLLGFARSVLNWVEGFMTSNIRPLFTLHLTKNITSKLILIHNLS